MAKSKPKNVICPCFDITKAEVKQHIRDGVIKYKDLQQLTKIGTKCSSCKKKTKVKFKKYKAKLGVE